MRDTTAATPSETPARRTGPLSIYNDFLRGAWRVSRRLVGGDPLRHGAISIPALRRALRRVPPSAFDEQVLRMERNEVIHLIPPFGRLSQEDLEQSVPYPGGGVRSYLLWIRPKSQNAFVWD
jgi:hypothetical protein